MKVKVNSDKCIGCGNCVALSESNVFDFNDDGLAHCILDEIPEDLQEVVKDAIDQCPTSAIEEVKDAVDQHSTSAVEEVKE